MQCQVEFDGGKDGTFELKVSGCFLEMDELKDGGFFLQQENEIITNKCTSAE